VHLNADARAALEAWIAERRERFPEPPQTALFLNRTGGRLSARSIDEALRRSAWRLGWRCRHTSCATPA